MRFNFKHATANRAHTQNVITEFSYSTGAKGYGEGCPREYVTGESVESALAFIKQFGPELAVAATDLKTLSAWIQANSLLIDQHPAAFCALELGIIDSLAKLSNQSAERFLNLPSLATPAQYTAVVGDSNLLKTRLMMAAYQAYGFKDFKFKISGDLNRDRSRIAHLPKNARIRLDANNFWSHAKEAVAYINALQTTAWAIEEPVEACSYESLNKVSRELRIPIILDESLYTKEHLKQAANYLDGFDVILGAQVAETSILTRAALTVSNGLSKAPLAREGAYGTLLLKNDLCAHSVRFTRGGIIKSNLSVLTQVGFGLDVSAESICWVG